MQLVLSSSHAMSIRLLHIFRMVQDGLHVFKDQIGVIQWDYWINRNQPVFPEAHSRGGPQARRCAALFWARAAEHPSTVGKVWDLVAGR